MAAALSSASVQGTTSQFPVPAGKVENKITGVARKELELALLKACEQENYAKIKELLNKPVDGYKYSTFIEVQEVTSWSSVKEEDRREIRGKLPADFKKSFIVEQSWNGLGVFLFFFVLPAILFCVLAIASGGSTLPLAIVLQIAVGSIVILTMILKRYTGLPFHQLFPFFLPGNRMIAKP